MANPIVQRNRLLREADEALQQFEECSHDYANLSGKNVPNADGQNNSWKTYNQLIELAQPMDLIQCRRNFYKHVTFYLGYCNHCKTAFCINISASGLLAKNAVYSIMTLKKALNGRKGRINNYDRVARKRRLRPRQNVFLHGLDNGSRMVDYTLLNKNCEHYSTFLRYGEYFSPQVKNGTKLASGFAAGALAAGTLFAIQHSKQKRRRLAN